ncbi:polysaccharide biosynthesis tyrosine autokinase [Flavobacterium paronense]|uniref:non-specific protein-tyrosine kinase n=1 Tax=Flavobacterium paronense TaxID=1392775 RepID=A0ABV5GAS6_9FLAO|nr:tyrosine-protein kinase family protein [Flavobacterium paronense]MDN3676696.1 polysaccharide biosynthesis tyrosine autokinase [Flavobacterium paronense]
MENSQLEQEKQNSFDFLEHFFLYLRYWHYFLLSVIVCFFIVKYYLNHTVSIYETKAKVKIIDDSKSGFTLPNSPIALFSRNKVNLDNEIEVLKSYRLLEQVCKSLNLNNQYYNVGYLNNIEIWKNRPFTIDWLEDASKMENKSISFEIEIANNGYKVITSSSSASAKIYPFNTVQYLGNLPYKLSLKIGTDLSIIDGRKFLIVHSSTASVVSNLSSSLNIANSNKNSDILIISLDGTTVDKSEVILNEIINQFDVDGLNDRRLVSQRTIDFVNQRFKSLEKQLDSVETNKANYKRNNELTFITADATTATSGKIVATSDVFDVETQIALAKVLEQTIKADKKLNLLPANIGLTNNGINQLISDFNAAVLERDRLSVSSGVNNPGIQFLNSKLASLKLNTLESIKAYQQELEVSLSKNNYIKKSSDNKFSSIPYNEKVLRGIERQQNIKETLYLLLLQKREEAAINVAITSSSIKVIDYALSSSSPISPKKGNFYLIALLIGLLIPFLILYLSFLLDDKLHTKEDILKLTKNKVILAEIPHIITDDRITSSNDRSILGESFRILRTNLTYIFPLQKEKLAQTIMVTSTIKGEGKTFTALNLSISFSIMNKKVLLIGADMRNPQLHNYLTFKKNELGLQDYLHDITVDWHSTVKKSPLNNGLDIILSGTIPPNPAELLSNGRLDKLVAEARNEYDYIIIDTAPTLLVTDTLIISQIVDTTLYVVRADYTPKKILEFSVNLSEKGKLKNLAYVINNVGSNYKGYGYSYGYNYKYNYAYGYGYGYDNETGTKTSFFKRLLSKFKKG